MTNVVFALLHVGLVWRYQVNISLSFEIQNIDLVLVSTAFQRLDLSEFEFLFQVCEYFHVARHLIKHLAQVTLSSGFLSLRTYQNFTGDDRGSLNCKCFLSFLRQISKPRYLQLNQNSNKMHHFGKLKSLVFVHFKSQYWKRCSHTYYFSRIIFWQSF